MIARLSARGERLVSRLVRDDRALLQRGAVGHREAHRDLGGDVDVGEAAHAAAAEQRARAPALPHDRRGDDRARLDRLERVDLHVRVDDRVLRRRSTRRRPRRPPRRARARGGRWRGRSRSRAGCAPGPTYTWSWHDGALERTRRPSRRRRCRARCTRRSVRAGLDPAVVADDAPGRRPARRGRPRRPRRATRRRRARKPVDLDLRPGRRARRRARGRYASSVPTSSQ